MKRDLYALFGISDSQARGKSLERTISDLFAVSGVSVREPFCCVSDVSGRVIEQVDGAIFLGERLFVVEVKWLSSPLPKSEAAEHLVRVYHRPETHGLFISATEFSEGALEVCREAMLRDRIIVLATLQEIVMLLEQDGDFRDFLMRKMQRAIAEKNPFPRI